MLQNENEFIGKDENVLHILVNILELGSTTFRDAFRETGLGSLIFTWKIHASIIP